MIRIVTLALASATWMSCFHAQAALAQEKLAAGWQAKVADSQLLVCFQGKGSSLAYDAGVIDEAFGRLPALDANRVIVAGNSSGSILATYFSCFGFSETSVRYAAYRLPRADVRTIRANEKGLAKAVKLFRGQPTEMSHEELKEYIAFALGVHDWRTARDIAEVVRRSRAVPRLPMLIATGNAEVLDNRGPRHPFDPKLQKVYDPDTFSVSWKPEVYEFYQAHPDRFASEHPDLRLGPTAYIGKACTYFVDRTMFEVLRRIPVEERQGDIRLVETPADMALAIEASVSEPSYFHPVLETQLGKLCTNGALGDVGNTRRRTYCGGFIMPLIGQDVRRALPRIRVMCTGWNPVPFAARQFIEDWYLVDLRRLAHKNLWWADLEIHSTREFQKKIVNREMSQFEEFEAGRERARVCLSNDHGIPEFVEPPRFGGPIARALVAGTESQELATKDFDASRGPLETMRGLGPLLTAP